MTINALISTPTHVTERATSLLTRCSFIHKRARHSDSTATLGYAQPTTAGGQPADRPASNLCPEIAGVSNTCNGQPRSNDNMKTMRTLSLVLLLLISLPWSPPNYTIEALIFLLPWMVLQSSAWGKWKEGMAHSWTYLTIKYRNRTQNTTH